MKTALKIIGFVVLALVLVAGGAYAWASIKTGQKLAQNFTVHSADFPIPFPLSDEEIRRLKLKPDSAGALARQRALERGKHLVDSRYACRECHGQNFGGGVMVDAAPVGHLFGPNLTTGKGSLTASYHAADWDRAVRHGLHTDGRPLVMPSQDFRNLTDQELSDVVWYIRSQPPVDNTTPPVALGPVLKVMTATGRVKLAADLIDHNAPHAALPPDPSQPLEFGRHLAAICTGCHREDFSGGPIIGGPPDWPPAKNITPAGLVDWSAENFVTLMREGKRPDGSSVKEPMANMPTFARNMSDQELQALWQYLQTVKPVGGEAQ